jgi:predicted secreted Zn-dependent protease
VKAACALALFAAAPAFADRNEFNIDYFTVTGATSRELAADIDAKSPVGENGLRSDGYTRWTIDWTFVMTPGPTGCSADQIAVNLDIRMTLPRWYPPRSADEALVGRWNHYVAALRLHEDGHRYRSESTARVVRRALLAERHASDCHTLETRLNSRANGLLADLRQRQEDYDRETAHGRTQGAIRP